MKVAIVGSGISGLAAAHRLQSHAHVTLFEAGDYFGGHTHTVDITLPTPRGEHTWGVDTGFLVFNERTYPHLIALLAELDVDTSTSDMSFSVQVPGARGRRPLEWSGSDLSTVFVQKRNLISPRFLGMLMDLLRFNRVCTQLAQRGRDADLTEPLAAFLDRHGFGQAFRDWYFLPMLGCIWSCPTDQMLRFPVGTMIRFCHNHGLLQVSNRPQWHTVVGGARQHEAAHQLRGRREPEEDADRRGWRRDRIETVGVRARVALGRFLEEFVDRFHVHAREPRQVHGHGLSAPPARGRGGRPNARGAPSRRRRPAADGQAFGISTC